MRTISCCFSTLILLLTSVFSSAQFAEEGYLRPEVNLSYDPVSRWGSNTSLRQRTTYREEGNPETWRSKHIQLTQFVTYEVGFAGKLGLGVMYREPTTATNRREVRITSQYSNGTFYNALRILHRGRVEQRIIDGFIIHRWGYRLSADFPLSGLKLDVREFYLAISTEPLLSFSVQDKPEWDQRITAILGNQLSRSCKLQVELEYRWEDYFADTVTRFFTTFSLYYTFK